MNNPHLLARFAEHQATLHDILGRGERLLGERDAVALARTRWELARAVMAYQGFKHREIFDPVARGPDAERARVARRLKAACVEAGETFRAYVAKWSSADVIGRWDEYHPAAHALIADLRAHMAREKDEAEALLRASEVPGRPAASSPIARG